MQSVPGCRSPCSCLGWFPPLPVAHVDTHVGTFLPPALVTTGFMHPGRRGHRLALLPITTVPALALPPPRLRPSGPSAPSWPQTAMEELKPCSRGCSCLLRPGAAARGSAAVFFSRAAAPASPGQRRRRRGSPFAWWRPRSQAGAAAWLASTEVGFALPSVCLHRLRVSVFL